jgi:tetratricopeptide (TPR) repeat protein
MELVQGETLSTRLKRVGHFNISEALPIATQLCSALHAAHQAGILHRDFKCDNVMLVGTGEEVRAVVTDFGTARLMESGSGSLRTATNAILGTPAYMSPEQLEGKDLTQASDIYSLGLVLYEMVTGTRPFHHESQWAEAMKRLNEEPAPPLMITPDIGYNWNAIILRCLERIPRQRFSSTREVSDALQKVCNLQRTSQRLAHGQEPIVNSETQARSEPRRQKWIFGFAAGLAVALVLLFFMVFRVHPAQALTDQDVVVLADFTNNTGEEVFDGPLREALAIDLEQSPLLNILSDVRVMHFLKLMGQSPNTRIVPEVAREICLRSNSRALIAGSIARLGSHYTIQLKATDCQNGDLLGATTAEAESRETTLQALGRAGSALRSKVGESLTSVQKFDKPLPEVTTASLEALQSYSEAWKISRMKGSAEAIPLLERAVKLDPNFALAYNGLSAAYNSTRQHNLSIESARKAYELRNHVSEREAYTISGTYYLVVTREFVKALQQFRLLVQEYPNIAASHSSLGYTYMLLGQYDTAAIEIREMLRLDPSLNPASSNLPYAYMASNQLEQAQALLESPSSRSSDNTLVRIFLYMLAFVRGNEAAMQQQLTWARGKTGAEGFLLAIESGKQAYHGHLRRSLELNHEAFEADQRHLSKEAAADTESLDAIRLAEFGHWQSARKLARAALAHGASPDTLLLSIPGNSFAVATLALARAGDVSGAQSAAKVLDGKAPLDTLVQNFWLPTIRAEIEIANGHAAKAIELLEAAVPYDLNDPGVMASVYTRARAYLVLGDGPAAVAEFQKMLDPGRNQVEWLRFPAPVAYLGLARAHALVAQSGIRPSTEAAKAQARAAYEKFFALWKDADPDIPILRRARAEYAKLNR